MSGRKATVSIGGTVFILIPKHCPPFLSDIKNVYLMCTDDSKHLYGINFVSNTVTG
jgi:hypothetical protein